MKKNDIIAILAIVILYIVLAVVGIGCPIAYLTGISCAGCGMTRAWLAVLSGDFTMAFYYHPLFWMVIPAAIWILTGRRRNRKVFLTGLWVVGILFFAVYVWRMLFGDGVVVYFHPGQGAIACFYKKIFFLIGGYL